MSPSKDEPPLPLGKIAIKGFSLSSKAGAKTRPQPPPSNLGKRSRGGFGHDSDSEDGLDAEGRGGRGAGNGRHEAVTGFGSEGAIRHERERGDDGGRRGGELVIKKMANRDWRAEARRRSGKDLLPAEERAMRDGVKKGKEGEGKMEGVDVVNGNDGAIQWGLSVRKRAKTEEGEGAGPGGGEGEDNTPADNDGTLQNEQESKESKPVPPKTADEEALASLLGTTKERKGPDLIISAPLSEQEAYKAAVASAPDPSTLEDYERIPVEEFGAALLRGMGWKGEKNANPKAKDVKRRQNLLGLGAKELDGAEELGAWVQKSDTKRLNPGSGGGKGGFGGGGGERRPKAGEYKREKERERERREERGGGGYRREKERERESGHRDSGRERHREYRR